MLLFHFHILSSLPMGVPLEWNVFMMIAVVTLFVGHDDVGFGDLTSPLPLLLLAVSAGTVVLGNLFPRKVSFLPGMRYYAGNWDVGLWCVKPSASAKIEANVVSIASMPQNQMEKFYGSPENAMMYLYMGYAFRSFNSHGRAMFTLAHRAMAGLDEADYILLDGERICSTALGWNFGMFSGKHVPACGFSLGLERILVVMEERKLYPADIDPIHALLAPVEEADMKSALALAVQLRAAGLRVDLLPKAAVPGKLRKQADEQGIGAAAWIEPGQSGRASVWIKRDGSTHKDLDVEALVAALKVQE